MTENKTTSPPDWLAGVCQRYVSDLSAICQRHFSAISARGSMSNQAQRAYGQAVPIMVGDVMQVSISVPWKDGGKTQTVDHMVIVTGLRWSDCNGCLIPVFDAIPMQEVLE